MNVAVHDFPAASQQHQRTSGTGRRGLAGKLSRLVRLWRERSRERRAFAALDRRDLQDLGLSRWAVELELAKPFWRG
jgi:uncharacterized protein YjiS (DUF1127 family)